MRRPLFVLGPAVTATLLTSVLPAASGATGSGPSEGRLNPEVLDARAAIAEIPEGGLDDLPGPVDPQSWVLPEWMGFDDYTPIPGVDWNDPSLQPPKQIRAALILGDFTDRDFVVTQDVGSDHFCLPMDPVNHIFDPSRGAVPDQDPDKYPVLCNPFVGNIPREEVADFYADFHFNVPSEINSFHTGNEYWLENSWGLIGVDAQGFGPYRMEGKEHEYGLNDYASGNCPAGDECGKDFDTEIVQASLADVTAGMALNGGEDYDFRYLLHAGYDESGTWQQFGEILFEYPEDVTDVFGPPDAADRPDDENAVNTRYIDWTSFAAGEGIWSHAIPGALSTQGESDGGAVFAHELSHIFGVLDNYNNPFGVPTRRSYTGLWANLSRGSFGGPGGHHNRWQIPPTLGASMGSHHMLRNKIRLGFFANRPNELLVIDADSLATSGPQFGTIYPRAYPLFPTTPDQGLHGIQVNMGQDNSQPCTVQSNYQCDGGGYDGYTIEFVDRIGFDSYTTDHGILLAKIKTGTDLAPFMWAIDSHPDDINEATPPPPNEDREIVDFIRPESKERSPIALGDARQLADALFHAGTGEDVEFEYIDSENGLHFYVLDFVRDERGVASYRVAVRSLSTLVPVPGGVTVEATGVHSAEAGKAGVTTFDVTNTGTAPADLVRLFIEAPEGVEVSTPYEVLEIAAGETVEVPVHWKTVAGTAPGTFAIALTATSETDTSATDTSEGEAVVTEPAAAPVVVAPPAQEQPLPEPAPSPLPATGGGLALGALVAAGAAQALRRR